MPGLVSGDCWWIPIFVRDYPVAQTVVFFAASFIIVINIVVDIAYAWLDPRVRIAG